MAKITNEDFAPSDCYRCRRTRDGYCSLTSRTALPIAYCMRTYDRCQYYWPRKGLEVMLP